MLNIHNILNKVNRYILIKLGEMANNLLLNSLVGQFVSYLTFLLSI